MFLLYCNKGQQEQAGTETPSIMYYLFINNNIAPYFPSTYFFIDFCLHNICVCVVF